MRNFIGVGVYLAGYSAVPVAATFLYPLNMIGSGFLISAIGLSILFSIFLSVCWPAKTFRGTPSLVMEQVPVIATTAALTHYVFSGVALYCAWFLASLLPRQTSTYSNSLEPWALVIVCLLLYEGIGYVQHRLSHRIPFLWERVHSVHHELRTFGPELPLRVHYLEYFISQITRVLLLNALQIDHQVVVLVIAWSGWGTFTQHASCDLKFGRINKLLVTPELHLWHHRREQEVVNFSFGVVSIFDKLGGTFCYRPGQVPAGVGIGGVAKPRGLAAILTSRTPHRERSTPEMAAINQHI